MFIHLTGLAHTKHSGTGLFSILLPVPSMSSLALAVSSLGRREAGGLSGRKGRQARSRLPRRNPPALLSTNVCAL